MLLRRLFRCLVLLLVCLLPLEVRAEKAEKEDKEAKAADDGAEGPSADDVTVDEGGEEIDVEGMDCVPQVKEVEARRPIPIVCQTDKKAASVALRYRTQQKEDWQTIELKGSETTWQGEIPCAVTATKGTLKIYVFARKANGKVAGRVGRKTKPMEIQIVEETSAPPPALPNKSPPDRCFGPGECPAEMIGSPACPGTKKGKATKAGWGSSCAEQTDCAKGLACVQGSCEQPPKCEGAGDCPDGECRDGACRYPDAAELAERLGPEKHHWVGLHFAPDLVLLREAVGVCGSRTEDSKLYDCYQAGNPYTGVPHEDDAGAVGSTVALGTMRVVLSYEFVFSRFSLGARVGWAFRGTPKDFSPLHLEARALYSLRQDPLNNRFRPYLGLAMGLGRADASVAVSVTDCTNDTSTCDRTDPMQARQGTLDAYRKGSSFFFGPSLQTMFALANDSAIIFNINVLLPDVVLQPSLGYTMGL